MQNSAASANMEEPSKACFRGLKGTLGCQNYGPFLGPYYTTAPNI